MGVLDTNDEKIIQYIEKVTNTTFSDEQKDILSHKGGMCILASAGSGKTSTLIALIAKRILTGEIADTSKLLCTTYSKAGASEMETRLAELLKKLGIELNFSIKTMHAVYYQLLQTFGYNITIISNGERISMVKNAIMEALGVGRNGVSEDMLTTVDSILSYQINNMMDDNTIYNSYVFTLRNEITPEQYKAIRTSYNNQKQEKGKFDFDDLQLILYSLMKSAQYAEPIKAYCRSIFKYIYVDEAQDMSKIQFSILQLMLDNPDNLLVIGDDDQCLIGETQVLTQDGYKRIDSVDIFDNFVSGTGGSHTGTMSCDNVSKHFVDTDVVCITTASGKQITGTKEHIGFARIVPDENVFYTYLMYREGFGFRIGTTRGVRAGNNKIENGLRVRLIQEHSDKVWAIKVSDSEEEARYWEAFYAYKYGIPMYRFVTGDSGSGLPYTSLGEDAVKRLHSSLGTIQRGERLLADLGISDEYPHKITQADGDRHRISFTMFGSGQVDGFGVHKSETSVNSNNAEYIGICEKYLSTCDRVSKTKYNYRNARATNSDIDKQVDTIDTIVGEATENGLYVEKVMNAKFADNKYGFMPFGNFIVGMHTPVYNENTGEIEDDTVVSVEYKHYTGEVYDISIPKTRNYIANGFVVHNCIYQWRGADPSIILNVCGVYPVLTRKTLTTNYRCLSNIVEKADHGIHYNTNRSDKTMKPFKQGGTVEFVQAGSRNLYNMSKYPYMYIKDLIENKGVNPKDIAVLCRNNSHLIILANMLFKDGIFCKSQDNMRLTNNFQFRNISTIFKLGENTTNSNTIKDSLWLIVPYLKKTVCNEIAKLQGTYGITLKDTLGLILTEYLGRDVGWQKGSIKTGALDAQHYRDVFYYMRDDTKDCLERVYEILATQNTEDAICAFMAIYYNTQASNSNNIETDRLIAGLVAYSTSLIKTMGYDKFKNYMRTVGQYEDGNMAVINNQVTLSTVHGAKGKEWKYVLLFADDNVTFPSFRDIDNNKKCDVPDSDIKGMIDEGRRLHYVAFTRAKEHLVVFSDAEDCSVYALETMGVLDKFGCEDNDIIIMAQQHRLYENFRNAAKEELFGNNSPYRLDIDVSQLNTNVGIKYEFDKPVNVDTSLNVNSMSTGTAFSSCEDNPDF